MRGNLYGAIFAVDIVGSIPACAGEPTRRPLTRYWRSVYPRVCGGTVYDVVEVCKESGLSPRVRGNQALCGKGLDAGGSIPACAGEPDIVVTPFI